MDSPPKGLVCLTGASENVAETSHLTSLPGAAERLEIVRGRLLEEQDWDVAVAGCNGVFHFACPVNFCPSDPEREMIWPAVQGTLNVLKACAKSASVRRVVHMSSVAAATWRKDALPDDVIDESCWSSVEFCKKENVFRWPYIVSKTLAEQKAFEFANQNNIDLVSILPSMVIGAFLTPYFPLSVEIALSLITGETKFFPFLRRLSCVHVDDVASAALCLYTTPEAEGRYICCATDTSIHELVESLIQLYPDLSVTAELESIGYPRTAPYPPQYNSQKLMGLGFQFKYRLEDMYCDAIKCAKEKGLLKVA
eukprot:c17804_g1_i4 orf=444-1373(-)